jgi:hypothetical protein
MRKRDIAGPVTLMVLGTMLTLDNLAGIGIRQTWPVLLIAFGLLALFGRSERPRYEPPPPGPPASAGWQR